MMKGTEASYGTCVREQWSDATIGMYLWLQVIERPSLA